MSEPTPPQRPRRRRWWRWLLLALLLIVLAPVGYHFCADYAADRELAAAVAETDRTDPDWRLEQLDEKRKTYAPEDNAAETVLAAHRLLPAKWPPPVPPAKWKTASLDGRMSEVPPEEQFDDAVVSDLRAELASDGIKDALAAAEELSRQTGGRYAISIGPGPLVTGAPYNDVLHIANLLRLQAALQSQDGRADDALATARRIIVTGRSIGDEPTAIALVVRIGIHTSAVQAVERALAKGQPSAAALTETQRLLSEDAAEPLLLYAFRGERAVRFRLGQTMKAHGWINDQAPTRITEGIRAKLASQRHYRGLPSLLRTLNQVVEVARHESEDQVIDGLKLEDYLERAGKQARLTDETPSLPLTDLSQFPAEFRHDRANLRGAVVGLALERYRLDNKHWPNELKQLVPDYLPAVPRDPYDGREMRYRKLADGVIVYSVGPDGEDNGGAMNRANLRAKGTDIGFRLWDVSARRRPAAEMLPPPKEESADQP